MAIYGNLKDYKFDNDADDIRGADVYGANGEKLGEIDDVIFDSLSGDLKYVVVDTGGWLTTHRFIVPALQLTIREEGDEDYHINLTREQIERFPEYKEETLASDDEWKDYERDYSKSIETDGEVMHMKDSTRIITPEASQVESGSLSGSAIVEPSEAASVPTVSVTERRSPTRGRRLEDFEERLRKQREEILRRRAA